MVTEQQKQASQMPKWLFYGLIAKGVLVVVITAAVLWYAGVFG
ncbi:hypothetical protein [Zhengella mangrovi]|nr:hypothetical protein [Zhengella mangrovi]